MYLLSDSIHLHMMQLRSLQLNKANDTCETDNIKGNDKEEYIVLGMNATSLPDVIRMNSLVNICNPNLVNIVAVSESRETGSLNHYQFRNGDFQTVTGFLSCLKRKATSGIMLDYNWCQQSWFRKGGRYNNNWLVNENNGAINNTKTGNNGHNDINGEWGKIPAAFALLPGLQFFILVNDVEGEVDKMLVAEKAQTFTKELNLETEAISLKEAKKIHPLFYASVLAQEEFRDPQHKTIQNIFVSGVQRYVTNGFYVWYRKGVDWRNYITSRFVFTDKDEIDILKEKEKEKKSEEIFYGSEKKRRRLWFEYYK